MLLHGIFPPITTPFYPDGNVYYKKLEHNVERYSRTPAAGIVALGSTGEAVMLSDQEQRDVLKATRDAAAPNKVLIAGTGVESAIETLHLTEYAAQLEYDAAMGIFDYTKRRRIYVQALIGQCRGSAGLIQHRHHRRAERQRKICIERRRYAHPVRVFDHAIDADTLRQFDRNDVSRERQRFA